MLLDNPYLSTDRQMLGDIYTTSEPMDNLTVLCDDFGSRFGGTPGERQAALFMRDKMRQYGLQMPRLEPYSYASWSRGETYLQVVSPVEMEIPCIALPYCPSARLEAEMVFVGDGAPDDFERAGRALKGRLVMATSRPPRGLGRNVHRSEKYARSALGAAAGFIFANHYEGLGPATGSIADNREALMPGISVSKEWGDFLVRLQQRKGPVRLRLHTRNRTRQKKSWNVVGELPGAKYPDQWIVVGCHYDGHDISQGAHDPASGMVVVLEAARVLAAYAAGQLQCGVRFIAFGTEEIGLIGAWEYARVHAEELGQIRLMLNLDSAGGAGRKGIVMHHWSGLDDFFLQARGQMQCDMPYGQQLAPFSDHYPFFEAGVPTASMGDVEAVYTGRGFGHTAFDTLDKVRLDDLRNASSVTSRLILRMAAQDKWPVRQRSQYQVERIKKGEPNLEILAVQAELDKVYEKQARAKRKK
ncbi:MAG: M28 family peptidase [Candidatus Latescibacteria bacterium]|nr:M28 family peptidase [Candidatus Latescibacterota bacterium]